MAPCSVTNFVCRVYLRFEWLLAALFWRRLTPEDSSLSRDVVFCPEASFTGALWTNDMFQGIWCCATIGVKVKDSIGLW